MLQGRKVELKTIGQPYSDCTMFSTNRHVIETCMKQVSERGDDERKSKIPSNKANEVVVNIVKKHIYSFPRVESRYCRLNST